MDLMYADLMHATFTANSNCAAIACPD
jgi:hypothetical protein